MADIKNKSCLLFISFIVLILSSTNSMADATNSGQFILTSDDGPDDDNATIEPELSTSSTNIHSMQKPNLNIKITKKKDTDEIVYWEANVTSLKNISVDAPSGIYKIYITNMSDGSVQEYNNGSNGYNIVPDQVISLAYQPLSGYILDGPWRIEPSINEIPLLAIAYDIFALNIKNISVYDANLNDTFVQSTNWSDEQNISIFNMPYFFTIPVDKNKFVADAHNRIAVKIKFDLDYDFDSIKGPIYVYKADENLPRFNRWLYGDTHVHSNYTSNPFEFGAPVNAISKAINAIGLTWVTITDHSFDQTNLSTKWNDYLHDCDADTRCLRAEEVSCDWGFFGWYSHYLAYNIKTFIPGPELYWGDTDTCETVINKVNAEGFGYVAHPAHKDALRKVWQNYSLPFTGLEVWNSIGESWEQERDAALQKWIEQLLLGRKIFIEAGSDAHGDFNTRLGKIRTACFASNFTKDNIFTALKNGNCMMTDGPLVIFTANKHIIGESFNVLEGDTILLNISWNSTNEFGNVTEIFLIRGEINGNETNELILTPNNLSGNFVIASMPNNTYYRIEANSTDPDGIIHRAYTNPIWVYAEPKPEIEKIPMDETEHALVTAFEERYDYSLKDLYFDGWPVAADCQTESLRENLGLDASWSVIKCEKMFLNGSRLMWAGFNNINTSEKRIMLQIDELLQFANASYNPFAQNWADCCTPGYYGQYRNNNWIAYKKGKEIFEINEVYNSNWVMDFLNRPVYFGTYLIHGFRQYGKNTIVYYSHWGPELIWVYNIHNIYLNFDNKVSYPLASEGFTYNNNKARFNRGILQSRSYNYAASSFKLGSDGEYIAFGHSQRWGSAFDTFNRNIFSVAQKESVTICHTDIDCNDKNLYTKDTCVNRGTVNSYCEHLQQEPVEIKKPYTEMDADEVSKVIEFNKKYNKTLGELYFDGWTNTSCNSAGILDMLKLDTNWKVSQCQKFLINSTKGMFVGLNNSITGKQYVAYQLGNILVDEDAVYKSYSENFYTNRNYRYYSDRWTAIRNNIERFEVDVFQVTNCNNDYSWCGNLYPYMTYIFHGFDIDGNKNTRIFYSFRGAPDDRLGHGSFINILFDNYKIFGFESGYNKGGLYGATSFDYRAIKSWSLGTKNVNYRMTNRTLFPLYHANDILVELGSPAHIYINDSEGRITGYFNGEYLSEIPGSEILDTFHERYRLPSGENYKIAVRGYEDGNYSLKMVFSSGGMLYFRNVPASNATADTFELNGTKELSVETKDAGKSIILEAQNITDGFASINFTISQNKPAMLLIPDWSDLSAESIIIEENNPPEIIGISPQNNSIFEAGQTISISVNAADADNDTLQYLIFFDGALISNSSEIIYSLNESGNHTIAFNVSDGTDSASSEISISVILPPIVTILSPENKTYSKNAVPLNAIFEGNIDMVWMAMDGKSGQNYTEGISNLSFSLDALSDGYHNITVYANNSLGSINYSTVYFTIDTIPPNITIIFPEEKTYLNSDNITLDFGATDTLSEISSITAVLDNIFVDNGQVIALRMLSLGNHTLTVNATDAAGNSATKSVTFLIKPISATVDITPDTLNRKSKSGKNAVTAYIELLGYDVTAIDVSSVTLSTAKGSISAQLTPTEVGDYDSDGIPDRMVKFERQSIIDIVGDGATAEITISGKIGEIAFEGTDSIRIIH